MTKLECGLPFTFESKKMDDFELCKHIVENPELYQAGIDIACLQRILYVSSAILISTITLLAEGTISLLPQLSP